MTPDMFFLLASLLFSIGLVGLISRRNLFVVYMSIELMLSSVNLVLATFSKILGDASGSVIALLIIAVIAAEAAIFLAMIVHIYRENRTIDSDDLDKLKEADSNA
ncbi:NADH-quinone oxidoreductase subunit NuoK [Sulfurimonas sp. CS5]|jgi:NADH-quinone oxidoreductase subunit K|uniref:NADH-quinone oxidoreductase subunit NuoK n=1 Tax=Sulfurimonas sp. CS5 TaxID=3391145 RepID=UPI0039EB6DC9